MVIAAIRNVVGTGLVASMVFAQWGCSFSEGCDKFRDRADEFLNGPLVSDDELNSLTGHQVLVTLRGAPSSMYFIGELLRFDAQMVVLRTKDGRFGFQRPDSDWHWLLTNSWIWTDPDEPGSAFLQREYIGLIQRYPLDGSDEASNTHRWMKEDWRDE